MSLIVKKTQIQIPNSYVMTNMIPNYRTGPDYFYKRTGLYSTITRSEFNAIQGNPSAYCSDYDTSTFPDQNDNQFNYYYYSYGCFGGEFAPAIFYYSNSNSRWTLWAASYGEVFYANISDTMPPINNYTSTFEPQLSSQIVVQII